jgi:lipopolysaccharide/colanic/teichoic acid biosynthesis glycosyltransferase
MLVDAGKLLGTEGREDILGGITAALSSSTRETDLRGWYTNNSVIGVILTELGTSDTDSAIRAVQGKVNTALRKNLELEHINKIDISFHMFPDELESPHGGRLVDSKLYPDLFQQDGRKKAARLIKRAIDIVGSLFGLVVFSPLLAAIAVAIKLTSRGAILFKQERVGRYGVRFTFLKFRSMYAPNDHTIHQEYVRRLIGGEGDRKQPEDRADTFKIKDDPRITRVGKFLRKTSLDELPQLFNVLKGEMSLVGPRPSIPYEIKAYQLWHKRRFIEAKPGMTGLWQVKGRSKVKFDDMVRLDLKYAKAWSIGLDVKILLQTPRAVISCEGAH